MAAMEKEAQQQIVEAIKSDLANLGYEVVEGGPVAEGIDEISELWSDRPSHARKLERVFKLLVSTPEWTEEAAQVVGVKLA